MDKSLDKRVELHLHTVMSDMDSVVDIGEMINTAKAWGHKAVAITDHGVLQAFPLPTTVSAKMIPLRSFTEWKDILLMTLKKLVINEKDQTLMDDFVVFDLETTGFSSIHDEIIEIGAVKVQQGK